MALSIEAGVVIGGRYRLERCLGQGGMGVVWSAVHSVTQRRVALKFLRGPAHLRPELRRRFMREARAASAVQHPNVVQVHDVFELDDETPVMVMDLLDGETLGQRIAREGALPIGDVAEIMTQVVSAVGTAHAVGVVHRDLKPDNIFLVRGAAARGAVRVLDFGIAKLIGTEGPAAETGIITGTGSMLGTPSYMSPEQSFGEKDIDHRTDVWALGAILYECFSGVRPVDGDSIGQVVKRLISDGITPIAVLKPDLPSDLMDLIGRMLTRERDGRPSDLREVLAVLARHSTVSAPDFGPASVEMPLASNPEAALGRVVVAHSDADPSGDTHHAPSGVGPETAGAHTVSATTRPRGRAPWLVAAVAIVAGGVGLVFRTSASAPESASSAPSPVVASATIAPVTTGAAPPSVVPAAPVVTAEPSPASSTPPPVGQPGPRETRAKPTSRHAPPSAVAPAAPVAPPAAPPVAPAPAPRGGLAQKPPF